ncbi:GNAT family N-acetyltransferase [Vagococcus sp. JNUCC 83]
MYNKLLKKQFQIDFNCNENPMKQSIFVTEKSSIDSRYWARGQADIVCFKNKLLVRTENNKLTDELKELYSNKNNEWFLEPDNILHLNHLLQKYHLKIGRMAPYFIPKAIIKKNDIDTNFKLFTPYDIEKLKVTGFKSEAFCFSEQDPDQLGFGYYYDNKLVAICGANKNGKYTWEMGVEILDKKFCGQGIATKLIETLTSKIQHTEKHIIPVYSTSFSHTTSINVAINSGFKLGWVELTITKDTK